MKDIVIIGAGGFGREVQWLIERINEKKMTWNILGYYDDGVEKGTEINGYKVMGDTEDLLKKQDELCVAVAIGASAVRKRVIEKIINKPNFGFPNLVDPSVICSDKVQFGVGNIICAGSILTTNIVIEDFCIINLDCNVGHDAKLKSYVTLYPSVNISGAVAIDICSEMGVSSCVIQGRKIGKYSIIGAGAVVINDIPDNVTCVGVPAKVIKNITKHCFTGKW